MPISQKEIARRLNLSQAAISHVLNGREHFLHPDTVKRVRQALAEANYLPDRVARGLRSRRSGILGLSLPNLKSPVTVDRVRSVHRLAHEAGFQVMMGDAEDSIANEEKLIGEFRAFQAEGIILIGRFSPPREHLAHLRRVIAEGMPLVVMDGPAGLPCPSVGVDVAAGMKAMVKHLFQLGHRHLAFAAFGPQADWSHTRWQGVNAAYEEAKLPVPAEEHFFPPFAGFSRRVYAAGQEIAQAILARRERQPAGARYTAVVASNDLVALGVIRGLIDHGLRVPQDMSVTGFDGTDIGESSVPRLTTVYQPNDELARVAFGLLKGEIEERRENKLRGSSKVPALRLLAPRLVIRESSGPAGEGAERNCVDTAASALR